MDERGEIASAYRGVTQNDLGIRTDVIDNIPKAIGMRMLIRSMSPKVIIADEIGNLADVQAIEYAITSGVNGIFTAHGGSMEEVEQNPVLNRLVSEHKIEKVLLLQKNRKVDLAYDIGDKRQVG